MRLPGLRHSCDGFSSFLGVALLVIASAPVLATLGAMTPGSSDDSAHWQRATAIPPLGRDEVQLWRIAVHQPESVIARWRASLSADERAAVARFRFPADAGRLLASRGARRWLLAHHLGLDPAALRFTAGSQGKPALAPFLPSPAPENMGGALRPDSASSPPAPIPEPPSAPAPQLQTPNPKLHPLSVASRSPISDLRTSLEFNSSHSGDWVLIALARGHALGVDVERWRDLPDRALVIRFFAPAEVAEWNALPEAARTEGFFNGWARKEAYLKALGAGLAKPLDSFQVSLAPGRPAAVLADTEDLARPARWRLLPVPMPPGYTAALALPRAITRVRHLEWALPSANDASSATMSSPG